MTAQRLISISIISDTVCPFCYVGKIKLEKAIVAYKTKHPGNGAVFEIEWKPFYLDPSAPKVGVPRVETYAARVGPDRARAHFARMKAIGASLGIDFKTGGKTGSTRLSHRLIHLAGTPSKTSTSSPNAATTPTRSQHLAVQNRVVTELFKGYFEEEADITDISVLVDVGVKAGMDTIGLSEVEIRRYLESEEGGKEVDRLAMEARLAGVSGVPNFVINGVYELGGAQDVDVILDVFEKAGRGWERA